MKADKVCQNKEDVKLVVPQNYIRICYQFEDSPSNREASKMVIDAIKLVSWRIEGRHQVLKNEAIQLSSFEMENTNPAKQKQLQERAAKSDEILKRPSKKKGK